MELRLPLDLLLIHDVEDLEDSLRSKYAIEHKSELIFCKTEDELNDYKLEFGEDVKYYEMDEIETDRIQAVIDLLNLGEEQSYFGHLIDRLVK